MTRLLRQRPTLSDERELGEMNLAGICVRAVPAARKQSKRTARQILVGNMGPESPLDWRVAPIALYFHIHMSILAARKAFR